MIPRPALLLLCALPLAAQQNPPEDIPQPARSPYWNAVSLEVPAELGNQDLAALGLVDVTAAPFEADPTGVRDSTAALQAAIDFARDHQMVTWFPSGTYTISDTLTCVQGRFSRSAGRVFPSRAWPCVLMGSREGQRPVIQLAPGSAGFQDPERRKYVIHFWARGLDETPPTEPQPNISFNQMLVGLDVRIGEGNPGAVGIRHRAAQGSSVQDCTIDATHGHTGLEGGAGSGGGHANVTVLGGRWGVDLRETQPAPTISGFTLVGQREAALVYDGRQALAAVGVNIVCDHAGPAVLGLGNWPPQGPICLVDSRIETAGGTAIQAARALYLNNVWVNGAETAVAGPAGGEAEGFRLDGAPHGWLHVRELARAVPAPAYQPGGKGPRRVYPAPVWLNGVRSEADLIDAAPADGPPADLCSRHQWPGDLPTWQSEGAANVKRTPFGAVGDGVADDTAAIQRAIDQSEIVFLPKGYYRISRPLVLRPETKLVGVARHLSILLADEREGSAFLDPANPQPVVLSANDADAETTVSWLAIEVPFAAPGGYALEWRSGRRSIYRDVNVDRHRRGPRNETHRHDHPLVRISGHGGGRWWNVFQESWHDMGRDYRHFLIDGTREPLHLYQCNPEHARSDANLEIRGAQHVSIYGVKGEGNEAIVTIRDSDHIRIFGYGGNAAAFEGTALFRVINTPNFLLANLLDSPRYSGQGSEEHFAGRGVDPELWQMVSEQPPGGGVITTEPLDRPVLYKRGEPAAE